MDKEAVFFQMISDGELEIDSEGRLWRLKRRHGKPRVAGLGRGYQAGVVAAQPCPRVRAEYRTRDGYLLITTTNDGIKTTTGAHRVVWAFFNGPIPEGLTINHKNGVKDDNRPVNLEKATYSQQRAHALEVLKVNRHHPVGSKHPKTRLKESDVAEMRRLRRSGWMVKDIAMRFGMTRKATSAICTGRTWKHV